MLLNPVHLDALRQSTPPPMKGRSDVPEDLAIAFKVLCNAARADKARLQELEVEVARISHRADTAEGENMELQTRLQQLQAQLQQLQGAWEQQAGLIDRLKALKAALALKDAELTERLAHQADQHAQQLAHLQQQLNQKSLEVVAAHQQVSILKQQQQLEVDSIRRQHAQEQQIELDNIRRQHAQEQQLELDSLRRQHVQEQQLQMESMRRQHVQEQQVALESMRRQHAQEQQLQVESMRRQHAQEVARLQQQLEEASAQAKRTEACSSHIREALSFHTRLGQQLSQLLSLTSSSNRGTTFAPVSPTGQGICFELPKGHQGLATSSLSCPTTPLPPAMYTQTLQHGLAASFGPAADAQAATAAGRQSPWSGNCWPAGQPRQAHAFDLDLSAGMAQAQCPLTSPRHFVSPAPSSMPEATAAAAAATAAWHMSPRRAATPPAGLAGARSPTSSPSSPLRSAESPLTSAQAAAESAQGSPTAPKLPLLSKEYARLAIHSRTESASAAAPGALYSVTSTRPLVSGEYVPLHVMGGHDPAGGLADEQVAPQLLPGAALMPFADRAHKSAAAAAGQQHTAAEWNNARTAGPSRLQPVLQRPASGSGRKQWSPQPAAVSSAALQPVYSGEEAAAAAAQACEQQGHEHEQQQQQVEHEQQRQQQQEVEHEQQRQLLMAAAQLAAQWVERQGAHEQTSPSARSASKHAPSPHQARTKYEQLLEKAAGKVDQQLQHEKEKQLQRQQRKQQTKQAQQKDRGPGMLMFRWSRRFSSTGASVDLTAAKSHASPSSCNSSRRSSDAATTPVSRVFSPRSSRRVSTTSCAEKSAETAATAAAAAAAAGSRNQRRRRADDGTTAAAATRPTSKPTQSNFSFRQFKV